MLGLIHVSQKGRYSLQFLCLPCDNNTKIYLLSARIIVAVSRDPKPSLIAQDKRKHLLFWHSILLLPNPVDLTICGKNVVQRILD